MSNNEYKAPEHRVRASKTNKRYSSPFFFNPAYDTVIKPIVTQQSRNAVPEYSPFSYGYFRQQRFKGDYADSGTEIQIEDFRIKSRDQEEMKDQVNEAEERDVRVLQEFEQSVV
jgi:isopenicillin N synthase-like dioxygenase